MGYSPQGHKESDMTEAASTAQHLRAVSHPSLGPIGSRKTQVPAYQP